MRFPCLTNVGSVLLAVMVGSFPLVGCRAPTETAVLSAAGPLHLEEHLEDAAVEGSELPANPPVAMVWRFKEPQPDWRPVGYARPGKRLPRVERIEDGVRITLSDEEPEPRWIPHGGLYLELPDWNLEDWAYAVVELRNSEAVTHLDLGINLRTEEQSGSGSFVAGPPSMPVIDDGSAHSYVVRLDRFGENPPQGAWRELGVMIAAEEPVSAELLSVSLVPKEADFAEQPFGVRMAEKSGEERRAIYTHGDATLEYTVALAPSSRLDLGLGVLRDDSPVGFRVRAAAAGEAPVTLLEETYSDSRLWAMRSVDLSDFGSQTVTLTLETEAEQGKVGLWASPVLAGDRRSRDVSRPNVIFYIIDGAGADYMSLNGYNRANTPVLERLAEQGAMFERAYSSASWTKPSTASFMTSIPHSALGGLRTETDRVPDDAITMAEHLHAAGYQTAVIVSNPYSASLSGLERGADFMHETGVEPNNSESSRLLHESFWRWREGHPAEPYWVHFQSTDIHEPFHPVAPFSGLYIDPELRRQYEEWDSVLYPGPGWRTPAAYEEQGIDAARYAYAQQGLYDEAMAHNDSRLGELVTRLRERGEWEETLLIVAADHGYPAACHRLMEPLAPAWGPMFNSHETRVPMLFVWPGRIPPGRRFAAPVSMLDVLPTVLDLLDLPTPETVQGRSLAPLLLGQDGWQPAPIVFDEFSVDRETGEMRGLIEVVDGWWGASLEIGEGAANGVGTVGARTEEHRPVPLLLYNLRDDPFTLKSLHEERPDLVEKYTRFLEQQWRAHRELGKRLGEGGQVSVGQEQLDALRALGYIN